MKTILAVTLVTFVSAAVVFAQAESLVKKKARDLKRDVETQQTNQVKGATNAPVRR